MSTKSSLRAALEQAARSQDTDPSPSAGVGGLSYVLRATGRELHDTVEVARALVRAGISVRAAHTAIERLARDLADPPAARAGAVVRLPNVPDRDGFEALLAGLGVKAERRQAPAEVNVVALRNQLGLTRDEFASRFGLDSRTIEGWEQGRFRPDASTRILLAVIERNPAAVEAVLAN